MKEKNTIAKILTLQEWADLKNQDMISFTDHIFDGNVLARVYKNAKEAEAAEAAEALTAGVYEIVNRGAAEIGIEPITLVKDDFKVLTAEQQQLNNEISSFFEASAVSGKMMNKRATLLYGYPGNGKTQYMKSVADKYKDKALCLFLASNLSVKALKHVDGLKDNPLPIIVFIDEIRSQDGDALLSMLDGTDSYNNIFILMATNYPHILPIAFLDRPGRLDSLIEFQNPTFDERKSYLSSHFEDVSDDLVISLDGVSMAYLRELVALKKMGRSLNVILDAFAKRKAQVEAIMARKKLFEAKSAMEREDDVW